MDLKETEIPGEDIAEHWFHRSKAKAMMRLLGAFKLSIVLDVGAGSGFFSRHLLKNSSAVESWCVDTSYGSDSDSLEAGKLIRFRNSIESVDADLVLLMDVLEHVDDDVGLLKEYVKKVPHGSQFLISVPAFHFLWSGHDDFLEHKRRYTLNQLENVVVSAGLSVKHGSYYFGMVFPIAAVLRLANRWERHTEGASRSQLSRHHPFVNFILAGACQSELPFMRVNRFAGLTVFCLAESI